MYLYTYTIFVVLGAVMMVIPNVMGICTFSPPLNEQGNSTRGVEFFHKLTNTFNFHIFDNLKVTSNKDNPRVGNNGNLYSVLCLNGSNQDV